MRRAAKRGLDPNKWFHNVELEEARRSEEMAELERNGLRIGAGCAECKREQDCQRR